MGFGWTDVAFGLVVRRWHEQVVSKTQHVVLTVAQHFQQDAAEGLGDGLGRSGEAAHLRQADPHSVAETLEPHCLGARLDGVLTLPAGEVGGMDKPAQRGLDLGRPGGFGVGLGAVFKIA
ncbi:hypothetical protein OG339_06495 [Streptosporangium sp. NBC_01495]|nr:hypothetical protein [Streptosporangium sp. NBC_01495]